MRVGLDRVAENGGLAAPCVAAQIEREVCPGVGDASLGVGVAGGPVGEIREPVLQRPFGGAFEGSTRARKFCSLDQARI